ncbi:iclR helix-turn-helix domain protein [Bordetella holmesii ATCC 51541]|nr:iclR helix-turn-helix domain protein [Bordetella holmesii ATCC 51541]
MQEQVAGGADRVLYVLATLARHESPLTIAALAEQTGLAQSTLYRQIALLKRWGSCWSRPAPTARVRPAYNWRVALINRRF